MANLITPLSNIGKTTYNKENYRIVFRVWRLKQAIKDFFDPSKKDNVEFSTVLYHDYINEFKVTNDLLTPVIVGELIYNDLSFYSCSKLSGNGKCFVECIVHKLKSKQSDAELDENEIEFAHNFLISDMEIVDQRLDGATYRISLVSLDIFSFNNNLTYTSRGEKNIVKLLTEVLEASELPYETTLKDSSLKLHYTALSNSTLSDSLKYLIHLGLCEPHGLIFFYYDCLTKKYKLISLRDEFKKYADGKNKFLNENILTLPTSDFVISQHVSINDVNDRNLNTANLSYNLYKDVVFRQFNYDRRKFEKEKITFEQMKDLMPKTKFEEYEIDLNKQNYVKPPINRYLKEYSYRFDDEYYDNIKDLTLYNRVIEFATVGSLKRNVGQVINLGVGDNEIGKKFIGYWLIQRITHTFSGGFYTNNIHASRIEEFKVNT